MTMKKKNGEKVEPSDLELRHLTCRLHVSHSDYDFNNNSKKRTKNLIKFTIYSKVHQEINLFDKPCDIL